MKYGTITRALALGASLLTAVPEYVDARSQGRARDCSPANTDYNSYLKGSETSMAKQNQMADKMNLTRIEDDAMLQRFITKGKLTRLPRSGRGFYVDPNLPDDRAYTRPFVKTFVENLARDYSAKFGRPFKVTSMVRTKEYQRELQNHNANAATVDGPKSSVHLTGAAVDISKLGRTNQEGMSQAELNWMRRQLASLECKGLIEATEEGIFQQTFHVMVFDNYPASVRR